MKYTHDVFPTQIFFTVPHSTNASTTRMMAILAAWRSLPLMLPQA